jgi:hypothetical protein
MSSVKTRQDRLTLLTNLATRSTELAANLWRARGRGAGPRAGVGASAAPTVPLLALAARPTCLACPTRIACLAPLSLASLISLACEQTCLCAPVGATDLPGFGPLVRRARACAPCSHPTGALECGRRRIFRSSGVGSRHQRSLSERQRQRPGSHGAVPRGQSATARAISRTHRRGSAAARCRSQSSARRCCCRPTREPAAATARRGPPPSRPR